MALKRQIAYIVPDVNLKFIPAPALIPNVFRSPATGTRIFGRTPLYSTTLGGGAGSGDRRDLPSDVFMPGGGGLDPGRVKVKEGGSMAHIFGIPHTVSGIIGGIVEGIGSVFGGPGPMQLPQAPPDFYSGWDITASAPQLAIEGLSAFSDVWNESKELNVAENGGTFLGCPVEEESGCEPHKKRYTITIDNATGKCIKIKRQKSRKRRRRLASLSDIKDLAALKQVIGGGKAFDTWIATRGR